jgi:formylglycine-generating enzyme required for sulfatase activity
MTAPDSDASAALSRALLWMADASDGALTSKELAELLWLLPRMPLSSSTPTPPEGIDHPRPEPIRSASKPEIEVVDDEGMGDEPDDFVPPAPEAIDPDTPLVFPELPGGAASPPQEPLLPLALLPEAAELEELQATLAVRLAQAPPLGDPASLIRALRPLLRRRPNTNRLKLDEERTAEAWAQTTLLLPLFEPTPAPWFEEVWVVVDGGQAMRVWHGMARTLQTILASTQVFPEVRLHWLSTKGSPAGEVRPREGSLVLLVSDATGAHWWDGRMFDALEVWSRQCPTAILQPWPPLQWDRTALSAGEPMSIRNSAPAAANLCYLAERQDWWEEETLPVSPTVIPVIPAEQEALAIWSAVVMGEPGYATQGFALPAPSMRWASLQKRLAVAQPVPGTGSGGDDRPVAELWAAFCRSASPQAQRLLMVMATAPVLTLPVIGLLHEAKVHGSKSPLPIAEVLASTMVAPIPNQEDVRDADQLQFALVPGLAELLINRLSAADRLDVIRTVGALVERRWNSRYREPTFGAVLLNPNLLPEHKKDELGKGMVQFASVTARLLDTLPGEEARAFAERIRQGSGLSPASPWPPSMVFKELEVDTAQLLAVPELEAIPFTAARLVEVELRRIGFQTAMLQPDLTPRISEGEALAFHEPLQRDHLPFGATAEKPDPLALTLVEIPAGEFLMGSPVEEKGSFNDERPQHLVRLESFFMGQTPITQAQWREVAQWEEREGERWGRELKPNPSRLQKPGDARLFQGETSTDGRPVDRVSWEDAMEFCLRLCQRTGRTYTLPSEAQWEYACRAGSKTPFAFGETLTDELANYNGNYTYGKAPKGEFREQTTPVGMFPANAWGLQDMHGNVREWCLDAWHGSYEGDPKDGSAWISEEKKEDRLLRGGSWFVNPWNCRSAFRFHFRSDYADYTIGFRVVCLPQGPSLNT